MRMTYTDLKTDFLENTGNPGSTDTTLVAFFDRHLGPKYQLILSESTNHQTQKSQTASTVADQQYYHYPPGVVDLENARIASGSQTFPMDVVSSTARWNWLNSLTYSGSIPEFIFPRRDDFGVWPIPSGANTITFDYHYRDRNLTTADYTAGTVAVTLNSTTITGTDTTWTAAMVGRWFLATTARHGYEYRIAAFNSTTSLTLESVYEGDTENGLSYRIGESPEIPEEGHILLSQGVTADWYAGPGQDITKGTWWNNVFWTGDGNNNSRSVEDTNGGLLGLKKRYAQRANSRVIRRNRNQYSKNNERWSMTLS